MMWYNVKLKQVILQLVVKLNLISVSRNHRKNVEMWEYHVDNSSESRYDMISGRYILKKLVSN